MDGYEVMPIAKAAPVGDIFCHPDRRHSNVIRKEHFLKMKDGATCVLRPFRCGAGVYPP